jgi:two-component system, cell cycle response regulator DivK
VQPTPIPRRTSSRLGPLVLVIEDDVDTLAFYVAALRASGFRTAEAADGRSGVDKALALRPAVIVADLLLPLLDGWEVIRCLKADFRTKEIPLLVVSGCVREIDERRATDAGCDAFLAKPCEVSVFVATVRAFLSSVPSAPQR